MKLKIHSMSSAITNSSATVYCYAKESGIESIKAIVNEVLKIADSQQTFDDLYEISIEYDDGIYERAMDVYCYDETKNMSYDESIAYAKRYTKDNKINLADLSEGEYDTFYQITPKTGDKTALNLINGLFDHEATYD